MVGGMWEFPVDVMDAREFYSGKWRQNKSIEEIIEQTKDKIKGCKEAGKEWLNLLFHDRYFCDASAGYRKWYEEIVGYLRNHKCTFIDFDSAIEELNSSEAQ